MDRVEAPEPKDDDIVIVMQAEGRCGDRLSGNGAGLFLDAWMYPSGPRGFAVEAHPESKTIMFRLVKMPPEAAP
jgi:hypothetical protein